MARFMYNDTPVYRAKVVTRTFDGREIANYYGPYANKAQASSQLKRERKYLGIKFIWGEVEESSGWNPVDKSCILG